MTKTAMRLLLAAPRGFCAGVDRAIKIVELALQAKSEPVYVRHEIVHNRHVVSTLEQQGAVFVEELDEVPDGATVVFSAHGVPKAVPEEAGRRGLGYLDATCPLVSKVHREAERHYEEGRHILLLGHEGHPEVVGTMGQLPAGAITLLEDLEAARRFQPLADQTLAFITQTTLSVDDTAEMIAVLRQRFPAIVGPRKEDICYATSNRQAAVKAIAGRCDALIVVGAPNSSNSLRLVEVARRNGCERAWLVQRAADIDWSHLSNCRSVGLTAGASAPESLVQEVADAFRQRYIVEVEEVRVAHENIEFKLPREVRPPA